MRVSKVAGGAGVVCLGVALAFLVRTGRIANEASASSSPATEAPDQPPEAAIDPTSSHQPFTPYGLGPDPLQFDQMTAAEQAGTEAVYERIEASFPSTVHPAYNRAVAEAIEAARREHAAREVGLQGTDDQGVIP
jgi:hypothetical protein